MALIIGFLLFLGGIGALVGGLKKVQLRRHIRDTPTATPGSVALGLAEVTGEAQPVSESLQAPLKDQPCLLYHYAFLYRYEDPDDNGYEWSAFKSGTHGVPFFLEGRRGRVYVDPTDAEIRLPSQRQDLITGDPPSSSVFWNPDDPPEEVQAFQNRCDDLSNRRVDPYRYIERSDDPGPLLSFTQLSDVNESSDKHALVIEQAAPGDELYVLGQAEAVPDDMDLPRDVSAVFRKEIEDPTQKSLTERFSPSASWSTDYQSVFTISTQSEEELVQDLNSQERAQLIGGVLLFVIGLAMLVLPFV